MEVVVRHFLYHQPPCRGRAHPDRHIRLAPGQVKDARQCDDLHIQIGVFRRNGRTDLRQQIIRRPIGRTHADLP